MAILFYSISIFLLLLGTVLYLTRRHWLEYVPTPSYLYARLPNTFHGDVEAGLHSAAFDMTGNIEDGDTRAGLDDAAKREVLRIMRARDIGFDEARRVYMERRFKKAGIGSDGVPRDPKFVSFS